MAQIAAPVAEFTIAGNLKDMFLDADPRRTTSNSATAINVPTLRIDGMTVAGG